MASATSASVLSNSARSECGASVSSSSLPNWLRTNRPTNWRNDSNSSRSALKFCKSSLDNCQRAFCKTILAQVLFRYPCHVAHVTGRRQAPAHCAAQVIDQHVMILGASFRIGNNTLEDFKHRRRLYFEARLFAHLAANPLFQLLA